MNSKGAMGFVVLMAIIYFMFGMIVYQFVKPDIAIMRNSSNMNCSSTATTTAGDKATCLLLDSIIPIIVLTILSVAFAAVTDGALK